MDRKGRLMIIPRPFPPPEIREAERAPPAQARAVRFPARPRWRAKLRRFRVRVALTPRPCLALLALAPLACLALALLALRVLR
jgi:hypothetical protein